MEDLEGELARLRARLDALEEQLRVRTAAEPPPAVPARPLPPPPRPHDGSLVAEGEPRHRRRDLLARAAGGAAAAVVGGTALAVTQASPAAAAPGSFDGNPAVTAVGTGATSVGVRGTGGASETGIGVNGIGGIGVRGEGQASWGVYGQGVSGVAGATSSTLPGTWGVQGSSTAGTGTAGYSETGLGVHARSTSHVALQAEALTTAGMHLRLQGGTVPPLTSAKPWQRGDLARDINGDLWLCVTGGTPGTWRRLAGPSTAGALVSLPTPVRVYDSRPGQPPDIAPKTPLVAGNARTIDLKLNGSGVPAGAVAVLVSLVATGTTSAIGGFMSLYRNGIAWPGTSNLNWSGPGQTVAVTTLTSVDAQARANVYAGSRTDVVLDVLGYYQ